VNVLLPAHLVAISSIFSLWCHKGTLCSAFSLGLMESADNVGTHAKLANWLNEMDLLSLWGGGGLLSQDQTSKCVNKSCFSKTLLIDNFDLFGTWLIFVFLSSSLLLNETIDVEYREQ
jgi:hypothetical protein